MYSVIPKATSGVGVKKRKQILDEANGKQEQGSSFKSNHFAKNAYF